MGYFYVCEQKPENSPYDKHRYCVRYGPAAASELAHFDHVRAFVRLPTRWAILTLTTTASSFAFAPRSRPHALPLRSPFVSPQARLLKTPGLPILTASSCQDNSMLDTSPVWPSLGTTPSPEMHITVYWTISPLSVRSLSTRSTCFRALYLRGTRCEIRPQPMFGWGLAGGVSRPHLKGRDPDPHKVGIKLSE